MRGGIANHHLIAYSISNIPAKNYQKSVDMQVIMCNISVVFRHGVFITDARLSDLLAVKCDRQRRTPNRRWWLSIKFLTTLISCDVHWHSTAVSTAFGYGKTTHWTISVAKFCHPNRFITTIISYNPKNGTISSCLLRHCIFFNKSANTVCALREESRQNVLSYEYRDWM